MTNDGGRANEPSSYDLRPPQQQAAPQAPPQQAPRQAVPPAPPRQAAGPGAYEPTQASGQRPAAAPYDPRDPRSAHSAHHSPESGRLIGGRYRLLGRLGHGGMGTVWKAHDQIVDREVAVKEPRVPDHLPDRERQTVYQRMEREARAAARIDHPSVVTVHDVVVEDGRPWIVMELVRGDSLADRLAEGTLDPREAARIGLAVLGALSAAHAAGVLHRDVKPDNVLLGRGDRVVLTDFGIAQVEGEQGLTETGGFVGSPEFISPERVLGQRPGPASDLWSLGVVLYAAVEGMSPFRRSHTPATLQAVLSAEPQRPARAPDALGSITMRLLLKDPAMRPSAAETREALESVVRPVQQPVPTVLTAGGYGGGPATQGGAAQSGGPQGGSRFVPPILHKNRKAQFGLGAALVVIASVFVLVFAQPFASESPLPSGWTVREERDVVAASLAVPSAYKRVQDDSDENAPSVTFGDPSGVYTITLTRLVSDPERKITDAAGVAGETVAYYKSGALSTMEEASSGTVKATRQQGKPAKDLNTTYYEPGTSSDENRILYLNRDHIYVSDDHVAWQLTVTMPARGDARATGDELYENVVKNLKIEGI
ncbi:serine/threonine-protein kinase [Streptomyces sp. Rer75]|uniref:serine/threonine-protein kinase n=1 Tax=Streptomyces sp. Rer75 TaxID=2750011 RepID=UPI0015CFD267|nr:serine/threonine-protein kinase [Streptomyces sp. Rer75]QLH22481.1 serine/threonine protein kinase [Streptomyces sp. Rer75]